MEEALLNSISTQINLLHSERERIRKKEKERGKEEIPEAETESIQWENGKVV